MYYQQFRNKSYTYFYDLPYCIVHYLTISTLNKSAVNRGVICVNVVWTMNKSLSCVKRRSSEAHHKQKSDPLNVSINLTHNLCPTVWMYMQLYIRHIVIDFTSRLVWIYGI